MDVDELVSCCVAEARVATGDARPEYFARSGYTPMVTPKKHIRGRRWTEEEERFFRENVGILSMEEIGKHLDRSMQALKVKRVRDQIYAPSKLPEYLTSNQAGKLLGIDNHKMSAWVDNGFIDGERVPTTTKKIRRISFNNLKRWLIRPTTWCYVRPEKVTHPYLRRLMLLARERWGDEWWTPKQVKEYLSLGNLSVVHMWIKKGWLPGSFHARMQGGRNFNGRWAHWYVRKSDLDWLLKQRRPKFSAAAVDFLLRARENGETWKVIARKMKMKPANLRVVYSKLTKVEGVACGTITQTSGY